MITREERAGKEWAGHILFVVLRPISPILIYVSGIITLEESNHISYISIHIYMRYDHPADE